MADKPNKLSDTARAVLTPATTRDDHLIRPPHLPIAAVRQVAQSRLRAGLAEEIASQVDDEYVWRISDGDRTLMLRATGLGPESAARKAAAEYKARPGSPHAAPPRGRQRSADRRGDGLGLAHGPLGLAHGPRLPRWPGQKGHQGRCPDHLCQGVALKPRGQGPLHHPSRPLRAGARPAANRGRDFRPCSHHPSPFTALLRRYPRSGCNALGDHGPARRRAGA
jgi:hypothetical protein